MKLEFMFSLDNCDTSATQVRHNCDTTATLAVALVSQFKVVKALGQALYFVF